MKQPPTSEGDTSIFGSPPRKMAEHGKYPSVMETSYEVPHHMDLQHQDGDKTVEQGPSPSTMVMSMNLFNNMKTTPILDSYSESSYKSTKQDRETSTTKMELRLHQPLRHLCQVFSRHLRLWM